jgi:hypothetical protein
MSLSSTSSSDRRTGRATGLCAVIVIVLAELLLRVPGINSAIGRPDLYYWAGVDERLEAIEQTEAEAGPIDVLFIGSSVVRTNIRPFVFDEAAADAGVEIVSFNGGLSGLRIDAVRLYAEEFWLDRLAPRVVMQFVRYNELLDPEPVETYRRFDQGRYEPLWVSDTPSARFRALLLDRSRLAQYSGLLTDALADPTEAFEDEIGFAIDSRGWNATQRALVDLLDQLDPSEIPGGDVATGGYRNPIDATLFVEGLSMLAETIEAVRAAGAAYVLVNMPEHGDKFLLAPDGEERYAAFVEILRAFATEQGVAFIDVTDGDASTYATVEPFSDFHHMTPNGAEALTKELARRAASSGLL